MPELPEVETIKLGLQNKIAGLIIKDLVILNPKTFQGNVQLLQGNKVLKVWRKGKLLGIDLSGGLTLLFHLKMTGQVIWQGKGEKGTGKRLIGGHPTEDMMGSLPNRSTRVIFEFNDGSKLFFNDQRKFGWIKIIEKGKVQNEKFFTSLGPEPLDKGFTWQILKSNLLPSKKGRVSHKSQPVKVAIMDQSIVAGIGNIYASEALFLAKINPLRKVSTLSDQELKRLYKGIVEALKLGIKHGGSTLAHFVNAEGKRGYFLDYAYVYGKTGDNCNVCGGKINKIQVGGRGTYFCVNCQD